MLEKLLLGLEIVEDDALRRPCLQGNLFDRGTRHALGLEDFIGSLAQLPAADLADFVSFMSHLDITDQLDQ